MGKKITDWTKQLNNRQILLSFSIPKTPSQVKNELGIDKFNFKPYLKRELIECLNPEGHKGRLYVLTTKAKKMLKISSISQKNRKNYDLIGWILASPRQRHIVMETLSLNSKRHTSEEVRIKSSSLNPCLSRISTKSILKKLTNKGLVDTEMGRDRKRYYWMNEEGVNVFNDIKKLSVCS
jgi:predicted transcriptional regulator